MKLGLRLGDDHEEDDDDGDGCVEDDRARVCLRAELLLERANLLREGVHLSKEVVLVLLLLLPLVLLLLYIGQARRRRMVARKGRRRGMRRGMLLLNVERRTAPRILNADATHHLSFFIYTVCLGIKQNKI